MLLTILNHQRHDWLNHFQVLLGYLRLGRPQEGEAYLQRVTEQTHQESLIARLKCPPLSVFLLTFPALHNDFRLEVEVYNEVDLSLVQMDSMALFEIIQELIFILKKHLPCNSMEMNSLLISLESRKDAVQIQFDLTSRLPASAEPELEKLLEKGIAQGAAFVANNRLEEEWILEMALPYRA